MNISEIVEEVNKRMDILESKRETAIAASRSIIRSTKRIIHCIHTDESYDLLELQKNVSKLSKELADEPEIFYSANVQDAMAEFAEVCILSSIVRNEMIPSFLELGITPQSWTLGLADSVGEIRRLILDSLLDGDVKNAEILFKQMNSIYEEIMMFDVPDAILQIRRKQDIARSVVEKTRTDLANAVLIRKLK